MLLLLYTGLRPGESIVLTGADIVGGFVDVSKAYGRDGIKPPKSKAGYRKVPLVPELAKVLPQVGPFELLFKNTRKKQLDEKSMYRLWKSFTETMKSTVDWLH